MSGDVLVYEPEKFPHGLLCIDCDHEFTAGERYSRRLTGVTTFAGEPANVCEIVCVPCGMRLAVQP